MYDKPNWTCLVTKLHTELFYQRLRDSRGPILKLCACKYTSLPDAGY